jgi:hypothetical protein
MAAEKLSVPQNMRGVLRRITGQSEFYAESLPEIKTSVLSHREEAEARVDSFEMKYNMTFHEFERACRDGRVENPFSAQCEKDNLDWETALGSLDMYDEILRWIAGVEERVKL